MDILISGASIAGPTLAFWLARQGHDVTVVERAAALREGGYAVDIRGPALEVIERMGLREALRPLETDTLYNWVVDGRGRRFGRTARGFGVLDPNDVEIHRGDLAQVLHRASADRARYRFGAHIVALAQDEGGVDVRFSSGESRRYDLVLGADGVRSRTRALAFGDSSSCLRELGSTMAIFSAPNHLGLDREQLLFQGLGRIASIKSADENRVLKVCVFFSTPPGAAVFEDEAGQRERVAAAFADAGWEFPRLMAAMRQAEDFYCDATCQVRLARYSVGRVALVGDAAYCPSPLSGQGSSLAIVGAYVLAAAIGAAPADPLRALDEYERTMRPFVERNQDIALKLGVGFAPRSAFQVWSRNAAMRLMPYLPGTGLVMKLAMRGIRQASRDVTLPAAP